jgi:uncharacterized damage-inducible protein DinB
MTAADLQENPVTSTDAGERADLLAELASARHFLVFPSRDLTDSQAGERPTVSALCLGGLIKHVASTEQAWMRFALEGAPAFGSGWTMPEDGEKPQWAIDRENEFRMLPGETLAGVIAHYEEVAARTTEILSSIPDLSTAHALPEAPWYEPGAAWSVRRVVLHIIAETTHHAGHADILRETIDGATSM